MTNQTMMKNLEDYYILDLNTEILKDFDEDQGSPFSDFLKLGAVNNIDHLRNEFEKLKLDLLTGQLLNLIEEEVDPNLFTEFWALSKGNFDWSLPFLYKQFIPIKHLISDRVVAKELEQFINTAAGGHLKKRHLDFEDQVRLMKDVLIVLNILHENINDQLNHICKHENLLDIMERNSFHKHVMEKYNQFIEVNKKKEVEDTITLSEAIRCQVTPRIDEEDYSSELNKIKELKNSDLTVEINFKKPNDRSAFR